LLTEAPGVFAFGEKVGPAGSTVHVPVPVASGVLPSRVVVEVQTARF